MELEAQGILQKYYAGTLHFLEDYAKIPIGPRRYFLAETGRRTSGAGASDAAALQEPAYRRPDLPHLRATLLKERTSRRNGFRRQPRSDLMRICADEPKTRPHICRTCNGLHGVILLLLVANTPSRVLALVPSLQGFIRMRMSSMYSCLGWPSSVLGWLQLLPCRPSCNAETNHPSCKSPPNHPKMGRLRGCPLT